MKKWGVGAAALGTLAVGGYFALSSLAHTEAQARVAQAAGQIRRYVKQFDYSDVAVAPLSRAVEIRDVRLDDGRGRFFKIGAVRFEHFDWTARDMPRYGRIRLIGVRMSVDALPGYDLKSYGYDHITAQAEFGYAFDDSAQTLDVSLRIEATDAGILAFRTKLGGLSPEFLSMVAGSLDNPFALVFAALSIPLNEASAEFEDRSLVNKALDAEARRRGVGQDQVRAEILKAVTAPGRGAPDPQAAHAVETMRGFLEKPGKIRVSISPSAPVPFSHIAAVLFADKTASIQPVTTPLNFRIVRE